MTLADINAETFAYLKPPGRAMFPSTAQGKDESETNFLARLREAACYCKFETHKTSLDTAAD